MDDTPSTTKQELKQLNTLMEQVIKNSSLQTKDKKETQKTIWKNIFARAMLTRREANSIMGFLRKISRK